MKLVHGQCSIAFHGPYLELIERLLPIMPHPSLDSFYFWNSGSEAVEGAVKLARYVTGRQNIISFQGQFNPIHLFLGYHSDSVIPRLLSWSYLRGYGTDEE